MGSQLMMIRGWNIYSHQMTSDLLGQSRDDFADFLTRLRNQLASLQPQAIPDSQSRNKIFQAPAASDLFTGRMALLNQVEEAFGLVTYPFVDAAGELTKSPTSILPSPPQSTVSEESYQTKVRADPRPTHHHGRKQKRFILVGLGGSGKTEFCRKFAEQNQPRWACSPTANEPSSLSSLTDVAICSFWGVFWIDATSDETVQHSYKEVAQVGGVDGNVKAAMTWLAGLMYPWLLVIDNADDPHMEVEKYFPGGERGHILVTTRRPALKHLGNVGEGYCEFEKLDEMEAHDLLLKHAREKTPWDETAQSLAKRITEVLGYLPLALVCAGKAIAEGITTLAEYISWFNDSWDRIRLQSRKSGRLVDETSKNVFAPYEAMLQALGQEDSQSAEDAIELLKMLSFLHHEGISMDVMIKAAHHPPAIEGRLRTEFDEKQQKEFENTGTKTTLKPKTWRRKLKDTIIHAVGWYEERVIFPVLPQVLRNDKTSSFSVHRLRAALTRLNQKSLVTLRRRNGTDVYSMHPLIHRWVRERPDMSIGERSLWCHAAITMLNQCVPLPPLGGGDSEVVFRRQLLPHLDAVRKFQSQTEHMLEENRKTRTFSLLLLLRQTSVNRAKAQQYARFSRLYSECGRFQDAADLQEQVKDYAINMLGLDDERTTLIMLALSGTYFALTRINDAAALQSQALETCNRALGPDHPRTLKVMDALGKTECFRGRFKEARKLHEDALAGMQETLPASHHDVFLSMDNLGVVWHRYFQYEKAEKLHMQALSGLSKALGKDHPDTLIAKENLAMTYLEMSLNFGQETSHEVTLEEGADSLLKAYTLEHEVLTTRRQNMGKENNWTLWAISNLARIKSSLGHFEEAEADMQAALEVGIRNLGESHFGILSGKTHLARVLAAQKKYDEAERMFQDVIIKGSYDKGLRSEGESPDHLMAVWYYAGFCQSIGKTSKAIGLLEGVSGGLTAIGATKHPFWERLWDKLEALRTEIDIATKLKDTGDQRP